ncbi:MAG TPA: nuclear transport factor 2 family protein [Thermodesulfobacteriota bacterium]|nr:nuclear transport factor 2 family protein [Thermodesulfobacteriota bacterium]
MQSAMSSELAERLIALEKSRARAWLERDPELLSSLLDDDFIEINYFGRLTREDILNGLFPGLVLKKFDMDGFRLLVSSDSLAVLSFRADEEISYKGNDISGLFHVTSIYRKSGGKWLLLVWQITPYTPDNG